MALSGTSDLYIVEIVLYAIILPITIYLGFRHGRPGRIGYFFLFATCAIRIASDIISLLPTNRDAPHPTTASAVLSSIGLSPLLLALAGFIHEAHIHLVDVTQGSASAKATKRWLRVAQFQIHGAAILGIVLAVVGNIKLVTAEVENTATPTEINNDEKLRSAGAVILLVLWAGLTHYALYLVYVARQVQTSSAGTINLSKMANWITLAMPFAGLRAIFTVVYAFDHANSDLNPITGALWVKVIFIFLASLGAVICLCVAGWVSRDVQKTQAFERGGSLDHVSYESVRPKRTDNSF